MEGEVERTRTSKLSRFLAKYDVNRTPNSTSKKNDKVCGWERPAACDSTCRAALACGLI
jgi:hypothetical protein